MVLFGLPFAAAGLVVLFLAAKMLWLWVEARAWQEVPARIVSTNLEIHTGDSTTYEVEARYRYDIEGVTYESTRVGFQSGADNIGSYQQETYEELTRVRESGEPFRCYVDPDDPHRAVLFRDMRWGLFAFMFAFGGVFAGVGLGLIAAVLWASRTTADRDTRQEQNPQAPWLWKPEWSDGRIEATGKAQFLFPAFFALFWNLISTPLFFFLPKEILEKRNYPALFALVFPLIGVGLMIWAGRAFLRWRKFGDSVFEMSSMPGVIGGRLAGRVLTSVPLAPAEGFVLTLSSIHRVTSGSGDNRSTREEVLWQSEKVLGREAAAWDPGRSEIPVEFRIPYDLPPTEERSDDDEILWRLEVRAEVPGVDYGVQFEVPVFKTADSRPDPEPTVAPESWGAEPVAALDLAAFGIESELLSTGARRLTFRAARHKGPALALTGFLLVWLGFNYLLIRLAAPIFFPILWTVFSLLIFFGVLDLWFERRSIEVHPDRLVLSGGLFGLGRSRGIDRTQIGEIEAIRGMQSGNKLYYRIQITTVDDKKHVAATKLDNLSLARQVIERLSY